jgi:CDP-diacylglycerol--glycerol-3-phosphate 3-phosphatidyltransferase
MTALILNILCYQLFYKIIPARQDQLAKIFTRKEIFTVPNLLSALRLCLAILFLGVCERYGFRANRSFLVMIIILAAATDFLDGRIARSFHQVSRVGRVLDPVADKAMQGVMLACLMSSYPLVELVLILFLVKEFTTLVVGWKVVMETEKDQEAQWHGKLNTAVSYIVVLILTAGSRLPYSTGNILIGACAVCMVMSFMMYMSQFREILAKKNGYARSRFYF